MTTTRSPAPAPAFRPLRATRRLGERSRSFGDDQLLSKLYSVSIQAALSVLLSLLGLGSAMAQSIAPYPVSSANMQASRDRVISELSQAREDGAIKRWSPILVEFPPKATLKGSRFAPFASRQIDLEGDRLGSIDAGTSTHGFAAADGRFGH